MLKRDIQGKFTLKNDDYRQVRSLRLTDDTWKQQLDLLTENVNRVLARSAILDDVLLELRDSHETHQRNFEIHQRNFEQHRQDFQEHQRTTNAALQSLEAILVQLTKNRS